MPHIFPTISEIIDAMTSKFEETTATYTRDDIKHFVIMALRSLTERGKIGIRLVYDGNIIYPIDKLV